MDGGLKGSNRHAYSATSHVVINRKLRCDISLVSFFVVGFVRIRLSID